MKLSKYKKNYIWYKKENSRESHGEKLPIIFLEKIKFFVFYIYEEF